LTGLGGPLLQQTTIGAIEIFFINSVQKQEYAGRRFCKKKMVCHNADALGADSVYRIGTVLLHQRESKAQNLAGPHRRADQSGNFLDSSGRNEKYFGGSRARSCLKR